MLCIEIWSMLHNYTIFLDIASYLLKVAYFNLPHLHLVLLLGMTLFEFHQDLLQKKTRFPVCDIM